MTLVSLLNSVKADNPVVLIADSGGAAAVLAFHLGLEDSLEPAEYREWIKQDKVVDNVHVRHVIEQIALLNEQANFTLIFSFSAKSKRTLDQIVLEAITTRMLIKSHAPPLSDNSCFDAARLAIDWDQPPGLEQILMSMSSVESLGSPRQRGQLLEQALLTGRVEIARSLFQFGCRPYHVDLTKLFAHESCERAFDAVSRNGQRFVKRLRRKLDGDGAEILTPERMYARFKELVLPALELIIGEDLASIFDQRTQGSVMEIFVWAVIAGRSELASSVWESCVSWSRTASPRQLEPSCQPSPSFP